MGLIVVRRYWGENLDTAKAALFLGGFTTLFLRDGSDVGGDFALVQALAGPVPLRAVRMALALAVAGQVPADAEEPEELGPARTLGRGRAVDDQAGDRCGGHDRDPLEFVVEPRQAAAVGREVAAAPARRAAALAVLKEVAAILNHSQPYGSHPSSKALGRK